MDDNSHIPIEESYAGEFEDESFDGYGIKYSSEGGKYVGEFKNGKHNECCRRLWSCSKSLSPCLN